MKNIRLTNVSDPFFLTMNLLKNNTDLQFFFLHYAVLSRN
jgi:hypothetical protein